MINLEFLSVFNKDSWRDSMEHGRVSIAVFLVSGYMKNSLKGSMMYVQDFQLLMAANNYKIL